MVSLYGVIEENSFRPKKKETFVGFRVKCVEDVFFAWKTLKNNLYCDWTCRKKTYGIKK